MGTDSLPWCFSPLPDGPGQTVTLQGDEWHHCHHVLRLSLGQHLILFNGNGQCMEGEIVSATRHEGVVTLLRDLSAAYSVSRGYSITAAFAPTKNIDRTEFAVEKLVELGIDAICFLECDHSERSHLRLDRMEKIILSAAKQSRKIHLPRLTGPVSPVEVIRDYKERNRASGIYFGHLDESSGPLPQNYRRGQDVLLLIGPEGGFSVAETTLMKQEGATAVTLGPYRLRVETAIISACGAIHVLNEAQTQS